MLTRLVFGIMVLSFLTAFAPAPRPKAPKTLPGDAILKKMQGDWEFMPTINVAQPMQAVPQGNMVAPRILTKIRIEGNKWSYIRQTNGAVNTVNSGPSYLIKLDPGKQPTWMDLVRPESDRPFLQGVVEIKGDILLFAHASATAIQSGRTNRPTSFVRDAGGGAYSVMTLKRASAPVP